MSRNAPELYGRDVRCFSDADALFTEAQGLEVVRQDVFHRLTQDDILGDDGSGSLRVVGWGFDVRRLLGADARTLAQVQPRLVEVVLRDQRVDFAEVELTPTVRNGRADVRLVVLAQTALGPFTLIRNISEITAADLVGQP